MNLLKISLAAASVAAVSAVNAATFATSSSNVGSYNEDFLGVTHNFTVGALGSGQFLSVTSLGIFDSGTAGIASGGGFVVLTKLNGDFLGDATIVGTSGTLIGNYRYVSLSAPIRLDANTSYKLSAFAPGLNNNFGVTPPDSAATIGGLFTIFSEDNANTGLITPGTQYKAGSFEYTVVPEPETYAMVAGLGLVAFGLWRRRQA